MFGALLVWINVVADDGTCKGTTLLGHNAYRLGE